MAEPSLEALQHWLQAAVMRGPGGVSAAALAPVISDNRAGAQERLHVYSSGYAARLQECLAADYPALEQWLGNDVFRAFCHAYLQRHPSRSFTLYDLGTDFAAFLTPPLAQLDEVQTPEDTLWLQLPAALAALERAVREALRAPGDDAPSATDADPYELLSGTLLVSRPACVQLLALPAPLWDFYQGLLRHEQPQPPAPVPTYMALSRQAYRLTTAPLTPVQYAFLQAAAALPLPLSDISARAAQAAGTTTAAMLAEVVLWLPVWLQQGLLSTSGAA